MSTRSLTVLPSSDSSTSCCGPSSCAPSDAVGAAPADLALTSGPAPAATDLDDPEAVRALVRDRYGAVAREGAGGCAPASANAPSCCSPIVAVDATVIGYSADEAAAAPEGANLGLGCGNPQAIAALRPGERVLDLGSGAGFDCFLAARAVGETGRVIGVDMTHDMLVRARANAKKGGYPNVEFRLGEIEHLPVADNDVDVILSNCVVNLSPDKAAVYREAFRVLKPGGRLAIADVLAYAPLSTEHRADLALLVGCIAGAATVAEVEGWLTDAGFVDIAIREKAGSQELVSSWAPGHPAASSVLSATIEARKP